ncbi:hypothetical protein DUI87_26760 [Hirundo rustica rustica]|uniref:Uncharacterized protein n=1 Tax=Hirundo rustica rustica TaxID=333673 RepID=A0A3M0J732_HIRRU|nr:hypothetical protein DUI87_26760 [Hirundo rustica rustica]
MHGEESGGLEDVEKWKAIILMDNGTMKMDYQDFTRSYEGGKSGKWMAVLYPQEILANGLEKYICDNQQKILHDWEVKARHSPLSILPSSTDSEDNPPATPCCWQEPPDPAECVIQMDLKEKGLLPQPTPLASSHSQLGHTSAASVTGKTDMEEERKQKTKDLHMGSFYGFMTKQNKE